MYLSLIFSIFNVKLLPLRSMSCRPNNTSNSSSGAGVKKKNFSVMLSCRQKPVRRATAIRQTPSTSITMTKHKEVSQGTSPRDQALCWETTM